MKSKIFCSFLVFSFVCLGLFLAFVTVARAAPTAAITIDVDTTLDSNDSAYQACTTADNDCSLRGAISKANADSANTYTIVVPAGVYTLTLIGPNEDANATGDLDVTTTMTITGAGANATILQAGDSEGNGIDRVVQVFNASTNLTLEGLMIRYGTADTDGGGIYSQGALTILNSAIVNNLTAGGGGGIYQDLGSLSISGSDISNNLAGNTGGGGIRNSGSLVVISSMVTANYASGAGGGIATSGGTATISYSAIADNMASSGGGGISTQNNTTHILGCTLSGNQALGTSSGGGIGNVNGTVTIANSTISGNTAGNQGGGIFTVAAYFTAAVDVSNSTFVTNTANAGGGLNNQVMWMGMGMGSATFTINNSIIAHSTGGDCVNTGGSISGANNLIDDYASGACSGVSTAAVTGLDPLLLDNGSTGASTPVLRTHRLLPDSNAIDAANPTYCPTTDQRGQTRDDLRCDIGAYELKYADSDTVIRSVGSAITTTFGPALMGIQRAAGVTDPGLITVTKSLTWKTKPANAINAYWLITPTVDSGFNLTLTLCYTPTESNGLDLNALRFWRYSANQWTAVGGTPVTSTVGLNQCATLSGITELSAWTLATDSPTAITLQALSAHPDAAPAGSAVTYLVGLLAVGAIAGLLIRKFQSNKSA